MKKKFLSKIILGASIASCASCLGGAVLPALGAQTVLADEVVSTNPGSVLNTLIEDAKTVPGLMVNVKHETTTGDADALNQTEISKLRQAMATQKNNHDDYESKANNPDYLIATKPVDFSKKAVVDFFTVNNKFDFADVNSLVGLTNSPELHGLSISSIDTMYDFDMYTIERGGYFLYKNCFIDKKTGKSVDVKITIVDYVDEYTQYKALQFTNNGITIRVDRNLEPDYKVKLSRSPIKFKVDFLESKTDKPIKIDVLWAVQDIDGDSFEVNYDKEIYGRNTGTYLLADAIDEPVTLLDGTVVTKTDLTMSKRTFFGETWNVPVATIKDNNEERNEAGTESKQRFNYEKYLTLERNVSSFEFLWAWNGIGFDKLELGLNEPEYKTSSVDVVVYEKQASPVKADIKFICGSDEIADMQTITGNSGELIAYSPKEVIKSLEAAGYDLVTNPLSDESTFTDKDQTFIIEFAPHVETITSETAKAAGEDTERSGVKYSEGLTKEDLSKTITRTIKYVDSTGKELLPAKTETIELTRTAEFNYVTGEVTYSEWTDGAFKSVKAESIDGYKPRTESISELKVNFESEDSEEKIIYDKVSASGNKSSGGASNNISNNPVNGSSNTNNSVVSAPNTGDAGLIMAGVSGGGLAGAAAIAGLIRKKKR